MNHLKLTITCHNKVKFINVTYLYSGKMCYMPNEKNCIEIFDRLKKKLYWANVTKIKF